MTEDSSVYAFGPYELDATRRKLSRGGEPIALTPKAFDVLVLLVRNSGRVVEKESILRSVWPDTVVDEGNLAFQISTLRKAVGPDVIATIPGRGYQLAAAVHIVDAVEVALEERTTTTITTEVPWAVITVALLAIAVVAFMILRKPRPSAPDTIRTVAVLPFKPIVAAQRDEALELGMADALIARISRLRDVTVRPLTAVRQYSAIEQDAIDAGRELEVDAVLDGSILSADGRIRVNARLLRVDDGQQIWHGQFDSADSDIFAVQESLSQRLAGAVAPNLSAAERERRLGRSDTTNLDAYRAYAVGRLNMFNVRSDRYDAAIGEFRRAIDLDPGFANAWASLAESYANLHISSDRPPGPSFDLAKDAAARALELDPDNADAHAVLGTVAFFHDWDWNAAERHLRRAIELNPSDGWHHFKYAHLLSNTGRHDEAEREALEAVRLEPHSAMINTMAGQFYLHAGRYPAAEKQLQHALRIAPDFWVAHLTIGKVFERTGRNELARSHYEKARAGSGENVEPLSMLAHLSAIEGKTADANRLIDDLLVIRKQRYFTAAKLALPYAGTGNKDEAFRWLERACTERDVGLIFINVNPRWKDAGLRDDPRWANVENCVNLPRQ